MTMMEQNPNPEISVARRRSRIGMVIVLSVVVLIGAGAWTLLREMQQRERTRPEDLLADFGPVPNAALTERSGKPLALGSLKGKIWVASFIFTKCGGSCPAMSLKMRDLQTSLDKAGDVKLVTFTVDPDNDTPQRLNEYAKVYDAKPDRWLFLTGQKAQMQDLAKNSFHLTVEEGTDPNEPIIHSKRFVLVDQEGHIRGYYNSEEDEAKQKLLTDIGTLMRGDGR
ncbi:MAG: SCO family protein [Candidatus Kapaibacterium sp.]